MVTPRNAVAFVNIHPQKSKWVTAKIILVSPASILVGEWLQRQRHIGAWPLYILFKCDVRHRLHCFVCTVTHLFNFTKGKTNLVNQRWRRTTCLKHQCYDVGCYPWIWVQILSVVLPPVVIHDQRDRQFQNRPRVFYQVARIVSLAMTRENIHYIWKIIKPLNISFPFSGLQEYHFQ